MLKSILSIAGKPGLFRLVSQGKNMLIVESLGDKKRIPAYTKDKVISLGDIAIYTQNEEVSLYKVLDKIKEKENGQQAAIDLPAAGPDQLRTYLAEILPDFDRDRVYPTDIRKLINWYNLLLAAQITDFRPEEKEEGAKENPLDEKPVQESKPKKSAAAIKTSQAKVSSSAKASARKSPTKKG